MQPSIKIVVTLLVIALIAVIGMIYLTNDSQKAEVATNVSENVQADVTTQPEAEIKPIEEAQASLEDAANEAQIEDDAQEEMYEGALAGLSEEEIAKMALAEEQSAARTETTGAEGAVD